MLIKKEAIILKDRKTVFNIVNRVDLYKNFVPYCIKSEILNQEKEQMEARLDFNLKGLTTSFTTKNKINGNDSIVMELLDGPFKKLDGKWEFKEIGNKTIIFLTINYEAKNKIVEYTVGKSLEKITNYLVSAFVSESMK
jgi:ribosome-associated toxin RatA of RatAB toxin-antitoxin module|tara:strand:- start:1938 stop:2354 length:417 start_codon:yes stop_codon:yes gene_type:complete